MTRLKDLIFGFVFFPLLLGCFQNKSEKTMDENRIRKSLVPKKRNQNILTINFSSNLTLRWDITKSQLIRDPQYHEVLKDKKKTEIILNSISNNEDLKVKVCTKETANLKRGDVAFLYLLEHQKIHIFSCLKSQFDVIDKNCKYQTNLLDYLEKNRIKVQKQVKNCIKM